MFVRSRPSRTRAERPIPGDRVLHAFDRALIGAHGAALDLVAAYLSRAGTLEADESGRTLGILAVNRLAKICRHVRADPMFRHLQRVMDLRIVVEKLRHLGQRRFDLVVAGTCSSERHDAYSAAKLVPKVLLV